MKKTIYLEFPAFGEQEITVFYRITKHYPATETSPEEPSDIAIERVMFCGVDMTEQVTKEGRDMICEAIADDH